MGRLPSAQINWRAAPLGRIDVGYRLRKRPSIALRISSAVLPLADAVRFRRVNDLGTSFQGVNVMLVNVVDTDED